jgi:hypothetical protein
MNDFNPNAERDALIVEWQKAEAARAAAVAREMELRKQVYATCFPNPEMGTNNLELGKGYKLKAVRKLNYNLANGEGQTEAALDQIEKLGNEGKFIAERLVGWKPSLSLSEYNKLEASNPTHQKIKAIINSVLTTTEASPSLEVVVPKAK